MTCRACFLSFSEAAQAVVDYTESVQNLLKRQKITKDVLFQYLNKEQVYVNPSAQKQVYVDAVINHWRKKVRHPLAGSVIR